MVLNSVAPRLPQQRKGEPVGAHYVPVPLEFRSGKRQEDQQRNAQRQKPIATGGMFVAHRPTDHPVAGPEQGCQRQ